ncbi:MAG: hypothetical protein COT90_04445 [Candidatus Diapherotrites archaeon CG10_big_fil_rev_8_21_14_0_10_31_34]|nr:MAG: hypothetical protein COT90_04445 [Candidatus Diapherotrites archaeon CG10_big_fil_rev_8_21_14_0_10_31_34]
MLNNYFDKFIFTSQLKFRDSNFHLIDIPFLIFPVEILAKLLFSCSDDESKEIYYSVKKSVKEFLPSLKAKPKYSGISLVNFINDFFSNSGFGKIRVVQFDEENCRAILLVSSSPFALYFKNKSKKPLDHILRGIIAGTFSFALSKDLDAIETKCVSVNSSECEFIVNSIREFDFLKKNTLSQLNPKI